MYIQPMNSINLCLNADEDWLIVWKDRCGCKFLSRKFDLRTGDYGEYIERSMSQFIIEWFNHNPVITPKVKALLEVCPLSPHLGIDGTVTERTMRIVMSNASSNILSKITFYNRTYQVQLGSEFESFTTLYDARVALFTQTYGLTVKTERYRGDDNDASA